MRTCKNCGRQYPHKPYCEFFCCVACAHTFRNGLKDGAPVTVRVVKVPPVFPELRPRLGGVYAAVKKRGYTSTVYLIEQAGKTVLLRNDEVVEVTA